MRNPPRKSKLNPEMAKAIANVTRETIRSELWAKAYTLALEVNIKVLIPSPPAVCADSAVEAFDRRFPIHRINQRTLK